MPTTPPTPTTATTPTTRVRVLVVDDHTLFRRGLIALLGADARFEVVAEERSLLARELHDSIAQSLAFLKIQVSLLRGAVQRGDAGVIERTVAELDTGVNESLSDVRELLMHFRTRTNAEDIAPALRTTLQKFEHQTGLATHLQIDGDGLPLDPDVQVLFDVDVEVRIAVVERIHLHVRQVANGVQQRPVRDGA